MKKAILFLSSLLLLWTCSKEEVQPTPIPNPEPNPIGTTIATIKNSLQAASDANNLILEISDTLRNDTSFLLVHYEKGNPLWIARDSVREFSKEEATWNYFLRFANDCSVQVHTIGSMEIDASAVRLNPFGTAPLTALVDLELPVAGRFAVKVLAKDEGGTSIEHDFDSVDKKHALPILGLYADYNNQVELSFKSPDGKVRLSQTIELPTEPCPLSFDLNIVKNNFPEGHQPIHFIVDRKAGFDLQGEIRWYYTGDAFYLFRKTKNGNLIISGQEGGVSYQRPRFYEVSMLGERIQTFEVPNLLHHDIIEIPNGNFLVASNTTLFDGNRNDGNLEEDLILEMDRQTGAIVQSWDLNNLLDNQRPYPGNHENTDDWLHLNSLFFDESDNSMVISGRNQSVVAKIDYVTGDLKWLLAHPAHWTNGLENYLLQAVDENGQPLPAGVREFYPYYQHSVMSLPNGHLWMYDNGNFRDFYDDNTLPYNGGTRAVEYKIDEVNKTVQLVWSYWPEQDIFTAATGDVDYHPESGHRSVGFMQGGPYSPRIVEFDANNNLIFEMTVNQNVSWFYRFEQMSLY
ncbi:MAG: aryl-sulfate sulfotransferase [Bacteroidota bacterium]